MSDPETFETHDIYLSAFFRVRGATMIRVRSQGARKFFIFSHPTENLKTLRDEYYNGATGSFHRYSCELQVMKNIAMSDS